MKGLKCKPSAQFAYNYSVNVLSKCSSIISHRPSILEGQHINHRSSKVDTSIIDLRRSTHRSFESRHIDLRRSTQQSPKADIDHRSYKVDTSISEGRHINHRSSKVDTSIFKDRRRKHCTNNSSPNIVHNGAP